MSFPDVDKALLTGFADGVKWEKFLRDLIGAVGDNADAFDLHLLDFMPHGIDNAGFHNSIYRGKDFGGAPTPEQWANIANGKFTDMFIGDFWTINGMQYPITAFNYFYNAGDTALTKPHVTLTTAASMYTHKMNNSNTTTGGYMGSLMYAEGLDQAKTKIKADFGEHLVKHRKILCNATSEGVADGWVWVDSEVELMNEMMVFGSVVSGRFTPGVSNRNVGVEKTQLPLFALRPDAANIRVTYWLQDIVSASTFARVGSRGYAAYGNASIALGVRPVFSIS